MARSAARQPLELPKVTAATRAPRRSCREARRPPIFTPVRVSSGESQLRAAWEWVMFLSRSEHYLPPGHRELQSTYLVYEFGGTMGTIRGEPQQSIVSLATTPASARQVRLAFFLVAAIFITFAATAPFASVPLPRFHAFIPAINALVLVTDLLTAFLLFGQFRVIRSIGLLVLAGGYMFTSIIVIPHALSYPGVFWPNGLFDDLQSAIWLWNIWHYSIPVFALVYVCLKDRKMFVPDAGVPSAIVGGIAIIVAMAFGVTWLVSEAGHFFPSLAADDIRYGKNAAISVSVISLLNLLACVLLWIRRRSALDVWLMVAICAGITEPLLSGVLSSARFDVGFYASRGYSVVTSTVLLLVMLTEITRLYRKLSGAVAGLERERDEKAAANRRLAVQTKRLRAANAFKSELISTLAHDLRSPLTVIVGRADMLLRTLNKGPEHWDRVREQIVRIQNAADHLGGMIENILSDARNDALDITIRLDKTDLSTLIHDVAEESRPAAAKKNQTIFVMAPSDCPVVCDGGRVRDAVDNLLSNAIKYSPLGGRIAITLEKSDDLVVIRVTDEGAGLSEDDLKLVFGRFQRLSAKPTANEASTGLGLSIVKRIVDLHGGAVSAESAGIGQGSTFTVTLPVHPPILVNTIESDDIVLSAAERLRAT